LAGTERCSNLCKENGLVTKENGLEAKTEQ
jgi:hypothetical protein